MSEIEQSADRQTAELLAAWAILDAADRDDVLAVVRNIASRERPQKLPAEHEGSIKKESQ